ncbi:RING-H2 finger protein ATL80, partial [Mucuna pruriens]
MTRALRLLQSVAAPPPEPAAAVESDFVVILAALLCALICVVGLTAIARCAWLRRGSRAGAGEVSPATAQANKGLKKKVVNSLPKFTYGDDGSRCKWSECAICLTEFAGGDEVRVLPQCGHGFHVACVDTWLASHSSCPSCRAPFAVARCQKCGQFPVVTAAESESKSVGGDNADNGGNANRNVIITNGFSNYGL